MTYSDSQRQAFKEAKAMDFGQLPDGEYQAVLEKIQVKKFVSNQRPERKVMLTYRIFFPEEHNGSVYNQFLSLDNQNTYGVLKSILRRFGHNPEEMVIDDVEGVFNDAIGMEVHFKLETKMGNNGKEFQNPYINAVVQMSKQEQKIAKPIEVDDDIPF